MQRTRVMLAMVLALGMGVGWFGHQCLSAQQAQVTRTVLLQTDLAGVEGKEAVLVVAEIAPGATTGKHWHAGQEFAYVIEGSLRLVADGKPAVTLTPGEAIQQPPRQVHEGQNTSSTMPVKVLALYVAEKGQPLTTAVSE
jgi:quercetin dioxygenase-like cupin family protein